ncbi:MAG: helix-turn-helix domain-containing protein, partial [Hyphomicrobiales bacterium]|nr:helix-turn-helix domain-containing protein [Hyphomicrobiales bacterium]
MTKARGSPVSVCLLALPETTPATLYGVYEVFRSVGVAWTDLTGEPADGPGFDVRIVSPDGRPFNAVMGVPVAPHAAIGDVDRTDVVIATDLAFPTDANLHGRWPDCAAWIKNQFDQGATVCSVCTGTVLLAEAGLLHGIEATTHWAVASFFARHYPEVKLHPERILSLGGPDRRVVTAGGSASWEDLSLYLIARFISEAEAIRISKIFLFGDRTEGQLPYAVMRRPDRNDDAVIAASQGWVADHYSAANPVARMVEQSGLAERTFKRRFKAATGYAPVDYVQTLRIEEAKQMLERSPEATDSV